MNFSFCAIVRQEAKTLPRLLASLEYYKACGGKVFVLDTGSTDDTVKIARDWGCVVKEAGDIYKHTIDADLAKSINDKFLVDGERPVVVEGETYFDFASARNAVAAMADTDWVSFLDADEVLTKLDFEALNKIIENEPEIDNFLYEFVFAHDPSGNPAIQFQQSKMYRRSKLAWRGITHEVLQPL